MTDSALFRPLTWADNSLNNRMVLAPMTRGRAGSDRIPNKIMGDHYVQRADAGLIITEATAISKEGIGWVDSPGIYTDKMVDGWRSVVDRVHEVDGKIVLQLWHTGRASHSDFHDGALPLSASAIAIQGDEIHTPKGKKAYEVPKAMSYDDIQRTVNDYKKAAEHINHVWENIDTWWESTKVRSVVDEFTKYYSFKNKELTNSVYNVIINA